jgi:hypothetical protein
MDFVWNYFSNKNTIHFGYRRVVFSEKTWVRIRFRYTCSCSNQINDIVSCCIWCFEIFLWQALVLSTWWTLKNNSRNPSLSSTKWNSALQSPSSWSWSCNIFASIFLIAI